MGQPGGRLSSGIFSKNAQNSSVLVLYIVLYILFCSVSAQAFTASAASHEWLTSEPELAEDLNWQHPSPRRSSFSDFSFYYTIHPEVYRQIYGHDLTLENSLGSSGVLHLLGSLAERIAKAISLLEWKKVEQQFSEPQEKYNRLGHFGRWIRDPRTTGCFNTRQQILYENSRVPVTLKNKSCVVESGEWEDPYTGTIFEQASDVQIDHVVPLKNAYISGAWTWSNRQRCVYANFQGNNFHLLAVSGTENMRKGDRSPAEYLPPRIEYRCEYLKNWLMVKKIWGLALHPTEAIAIANEVRELQCSFDDFQVNLRNLEMQRKRAQEDVVMCPQSLENQN